MTTLSKNEPRAFEQGDSQFYPVVTDDIVYEGAAVGESTGLSRPLQAGDVFQGFALEQADNAGGAAGAQKIEVRTKGRIRLNVVGATITSNALVAVYASDDDTFTTTSGSNSLIGYVAQNLGGTTCVVEFDAALVRAALQA